MWLIEAGFRSVRKICGGDEGPNESGPPPHPHHRQPKLTAHLLQVVGRVAGQFVVLQVPPDPLVWVKLRAVTWKPVNLEAGVFPQPEFLSAYGTGR